MDARSLFLAEHARIHSNQVAAGEPLNIPNLTDKLDDSALTTAPEGLNSIAWLTWHMARTEDIAINCVLRQTSPVLEREGWAERLGIDAQHIGTGDTADDLAAFNRGINVPTLKAYRDTVGRETRRYVATLDFDTLDSAVAGGGLGQAGGAFGPNAAWVEKFWEGRTGGWFLAWLGVGHNYMHLGEIGVISRALGLPGG